MSSIGAIPDSNNNINRTNNKKPLVKASSNQPLFEFKQTSPTNPTTTITPNSNQPTKPNTNKKMHQEEINKLKEEAKNLQKQENAGWGEASAEEQI